LAAEPHATAERKRELRLEATRQARQSPLYFDLTLSLSKSISIFHASLGENACLARQAGDNEGDEYWCGLLAEVDAMIWRAVHAGFAYFQQEAGYTRTGSHHARVHGQETGQCRRQARPGHRRHRLPVGPQHTRRRRQGSCAGAGRGGPRRGARRWRNQGQLLIALAHATAGHHLGPAALK
jgi:hypothetical protein